MSGMQDDRGEQENPFAAPASGELAFASTDQELESSDYETDRRKHLKRETNIKSIGLLNVLGGILAVVLGLVVLIGAIGSRGDAEAIVLMIGMALVLAIGILGLWGGLSLRALKPSGRIVCTIFSVLGLISINPIQLIVSILFLYILWSNPSARIFRADYREIVIPATPHIKYKTSLLVKVLFVVLLIVIVVATYFSVTHSR